MRLSFTGVAQVEIDSRRLELEGDFHTAACFINTDKTDVSFKVLFIRIDGNISVDIVGRNTESCACNNIFCILGDKWRGVVACTVGYFYDLSSSKRSQIYPADPWCIITIHKYPSAIYLTISLGEVSMMEIIPRNKSVRSVQHWFCFFAIAVAFFRIYRKHRNYF